MYARTRAKTSVEHPLFSLHTAKCQAWGCVFLSSFSASLIFDRAFKQPLYRCLSTHAVVYLFWNVVPYHPERGSTSHGTGLYLSDNVAVNQKPLYKGLSMALWKQMSKGLNNGFVCCVCRIIGARTPLHCGQSCDTRPAPLHKCP